MFIINAQYFVGALTIPNIPKLGQYPEPAMFDIDSLIQDTVHSLLNSVLGRTNYKEFIESLDAKGEIKPNTAQKWEDLLNGCDYVHKGKTKYFKGLIYKRGTIHKSVLAEYTYIKYIEQNISQLTGVGDVVLDAKNAINIDPSGRWAEAWNNFLTNLAGNTHSRTKIYYHNGVLVEDYYRGNNSEEPTLFEYLRDRSNEYPECNLQLPNNETLEFKNRLGL